MKRRSALIGFFALSAVIAMGGPARPAGSDWVDRMTSVTGAGSHLSSDWIDRMASSYAEAEFQLALRTDSRGSKDWIDRLVADLGADYARGSTTPPARVEAALAE